MRCRKMVLRFIKIRMEYSQKQDALSMLNAQKAKTICAEQIPSTASDWYGLEEVLFV